MHSLVAGIQVELEGHGVLTTTSHVFVSEFQNSFSLSHKQIRLFSTKVELGGQGLDGGSMHILVALSRTVPSVQMHCPSEHTPLIQALLQAPQFNKSELKFVQPVPRHQFGVSDEQSGVGSGKLGVVVFGEATGGSGVGVGGVTGGSGGVAGGLGVGVGGVTGGSSGVGEGRPSGPVTGGSGVETGGTVGDSGVAVSSTGDSDGGMITGGSGVDMGGSTGVLGGVTSGALGPDDGGKGSNPDGDEGGISESGGGVTSGVGADGGFGVGKTGVSAAGSSSSGVEGGTSVVSTIDVPEVGVVASGGDKADGSDGLGIGGLVADGGAIVAEGGEGLLSTVADGRGSAVGSLVAGRTVAGGSSEGPVVALEVIFTARSCSPSQPSAKNSSPTGYASLTA